MCFLIFWVIYLLVEVITLNDSKEKLINMQVLESNECLIWCLTRYLNRVNKNPTRILNADKDILVN